MCKQDDDRGGRPAPAENDVTDTMRHAGAVVLRRFYRQPFHWLAEWQVQEIYAAMNAAKFPHMNLVRVLEIQRRFLEQGNQATKR